MRYIPFLLALVVLTSVWAGDKGSRLKIGIANEELGSYGGCSLQLPSQFDRREGKYIFTSDRKNRAVVNVNGVDTFVALTRSKEPEPKQEAQVGDRSTYWYAGSGIEVLVEYVVTGLCPRHDRGCGVTYYDAILTVSRRNASKTVAARAVCETGN